MSVLLCMGATFINTNVCLAVRIASFDTAGLQLLSFCVLDPYPSKDIELDLSYVILL